MLPQPTRRSTFALFVAATALIACKDSGPRSHFVPPAINPIINAALPASLRRGATSGPAPLFAVAAPSDLAQAAITNLFQGSFFSQSSGQMDSGFVQSLIASIDSRMAAIDTQVSLVDVPIPCLTGAPQAYTLDLSAIDPKLSLTLQNAQCVDPFAQGATQSTLGSGTIFGSDPAATNYSLMLSLGLTATASSSPFISTGGSITAVNVSNYKATGPETADGMIVEWSPLGTGANGTAIGNDLTVIRFIATPGPTTAPQTGHFELYLASSAADAASATNSTVKVYLGAGFRMISDGSFVYADGNIWDINNGPAKWQAFSSCLNAVSLAVDPTGAGCATLKNSFTLTPSTVITAGAITGTVFAPASWPGPGLSNTNVAPSAAIQTLLNSIFPVTAAKNVPVFTISNGSH